MGWGRFLRRAKWDADRASELESYLQIEIDDNLARGMSIEEARAAAQRKLGNRMRIREDIYRMNTVGVLDTVGRDVRYGLRALRHSPTFTIVAVLTLALGIGANTAIFSLADAVLLRTLPVANPRDLVVLRQHNQGFDIFPFTSAASVDLAAENGGVLAGLAAFRPVANTHVTVGGQTELALTQSVSGNYHAVLGIHAVVGRTLIREDREPVAVISHRYWQRQFAGDRTVVGRVLEMQGRPFTIVGVTPPEFFGTQPGRHVDITVPLAAQQTTMPPNARWLYLIGRLAPGVSREQARAALGIRWAQLGAAASLPSRPSVLELDSGAQGLNELRRQFSVPLQILMAAMGVVLLVACANLAGLLIVRSSARHQEIALRLSLGATRRRIVSQLLTESALIAAAGGAAGAGLAYWLTDRLLAMMSRGRVPIVLDVTPNLRALAFAAAVTIVTTALFGLLPALGASRIALQQRLKQVGGAPSARNRWGRATVAAQVALVVILLTSAGLFTRTLQKLRSIDAGFRPEHVLVVNVSPGPGYRGAASRALHDELYRRFGTLPGVQSVTTSMDTPPLGDLSMGAGIDVPGRPADPERGPQVYHNFVGPRFFETMGTLVLAGRDFDLGDDERAARHIVISEGVARRYFDGESPLGRQLLVGGTPASIVGIVKDVRYASLRAPAPLMVYRAYRQEANAPVGSFLIRTSATAAVLTPFLTAELRAAAPTLPPPTVVSLEDQVAAVLVEERLLAALSGAIGVLAAILAAIGIFSTVASTVARRQREIGIRMALGALPGRVARMVVSEAFAIAAAGLAIGIPMAIAAALAARGVLTDVLFELSPTDPLILSGSALAILLIASLAAYVPARRASEIDPLAAVKYQ